VEISRKLSFETPFPSSHLAVRVPKPPAPHLRLIRMNSRSSCCIAHHVRCLLPSALTPLTCQLHTSLGITFQGDCAASSHGGTTPDFTQRGHRRLRPARQELIFIASLHGVQLAGGQRLMLPSLASCPTTWGHALARIVRRTSSIAGRTRRIIQAQRLNHRPFAIQVRSTLIPFPSP